MPLRLAIRAAALVTPFALAPAAHAMPMNGTFDIHYDKQAPQPIAPDHVKIAESGAGTNKSPGQPLDNAKVTLTETVTLVKRQGPLKGTITFTMPDGSITSAYTGKVMTDAQGRMTGTGKFKVANTTGAMAGMKGSGNFSTAFSSQVDQNTSWQGKFTDPKPKAASR